MSNQMPAEPTRAELNAERAAERGTVFDLPNRPRTAAKGRKSKGAGARHAVVALAVVVASLLGGAVVAEPAQAAPTCRATYKRTSSHSVYSISGNPQNSGKVYSFRVTWGWTDSVSTYSPTYRTFNGPRKHIVSKVQAWVNGYRCSDWNGSEVF